MSDVTPQGLVISKMAPGKMVVADFDGLDRHIAELVKPYEGVTITAEQVGDAKKIRAFLNGEAASLDQQRKDVKRAYEEPIRAFEQRVKQSLEPIKAASAALDRQIKDFEAQEQVDKEVALRAYYEGYAGALADVVPFARIKDPAWLNKSFTTKKAFEAIDAAVERLVRDEQSLSEMKLTHEIEAKACYYETLDLGRAIARSKELDEREAAAAALEEKKQAYAAEMAQAAEVPQQLNAEPELIPQSVAPTAHYKIVIDFKGTASELTEALRHIQELGFTGVAQRVINSPQEAAAMLNEMNAQAASEVRGR